MLPAILVLRMPHPKIACRSRLMQECLFLAEKAAEKSLAVLIMGPSGAGKDLIACHIHSSGARSKGPMIVVNCGALPREMLESELFGHVRGAFTGALAASAGLIMAAHHGVLFLDEIGDLPLDLQVKLLRFLNDHKTRQVGSIQ